MADHVLPTREATKRAEPRSPMEKRYRLDILHLLDALSAAVARAEQAESRTAKLVALLRTLKGDFLNMADWCGGMEDDRVMGVLSRIDAALEEVADGTQ